MTDPKDHINQSNNPVDGSRELSTLNIRGEIYHTFLTRKFSLRRTWMKPDQKKVTSFIPGTICQVFVKPGDVVDIGSRLIILEAMKMQNVILSPMAGKIKSVMVKEGEKVRKGITMVEFE